MKKAMRTSGKLSCHKRQCMSWTWTIPVAGWRADYLIRTKAPIISKRDTLAEFMDLSA
jgi:hypothetical protein